MPADPFLISSPRLTLPPSAAFPISWYSFRCCKQPRVVSPMRYVTSQGTLRFLLTQILAIFEPSPEAPPSSSTEGGT